MEEDVEKVVDLLSRLGYSLIRQKGDRRMDNDFHVTNHGSIITLQPLTEAAQDWCNDHLPEDAQTFGSAYAIEPRYFGDIAMGYQDDGLTANVIVTPA
jgi:hypothetical protein